MPACEQDDPTGRGDGRHGDTACHVAASYPRQTTPPVSGAPGLGHGGIHRLASVSFCLLGQSALTALSSLPIESFASPNSSVVLGSKSSSFSMPAKPGRIDRFMNTTALASSALRIGMP